MTGKRLVMPTCVRCNKEMDSFTLSERGRCNHCGFDVIDMARLLPELLLAARCALADLEGIMIKYDPDSYHPGWTTMDELRAAIAKATGEQYNRKEEPK